MKCDGPCAVKLLSTLGSVACYILLIGFWRSLEAEYYRFILSTIFTGYGLLYISFTVAMLCREEVDRRFNMLFAMYGVGAYLGAASSCMVHVFVEKKEPGKNYCLAAGAVAAIQAILLTVEVFILLNYQYHEVAPRIPHDLSVRSTGKEQSSKDLPKPYSVQLQQRPP